MRLLRIEPDVLAVAALSCLMLVPQAWSASPPHPARFRIHAISTADLEFPSSLSAVTGLENFAAWTTALERRSDRVLQRLSERMRAFEQRYSRYSTAPPPARSIHCDPDSE